MEVPALEKVRVGENPVGVERRVVGDRGERDDERHALERGGESRGSRRGEDRIRSREQHRRPPRRELPQDGFGRAFGIGNGQREAPLRRRRVEAARGRPPRSDPAGARATERAAPPPGTRTPPGASRLPASAFRTCAARWSKSRPGRSGPRRGPTASRLRAAANSRAMRRITLTEIPGLGGDALEAVVLLEQRSQRRPPVARLLETGRSARGRIPCRRGPRRRSRPRRRARRCPPCRVGRRSIRRPRPPSCESRGSTWTSFPRRPVRPWRNSPYARVVCTGELDASRSDAPREST